MWTSREIYESIEWIAVQATEIFIFSETVKNKYDCRKIALHKNPQWWAIQEHFKNKSLDGT